MASANFTASDGCALKPGRHTQLRLPLSLHPSGVNTSSWKTMAPASAGHARARSSRTGSRDATIMSGRPMRA